jgi:hypothetical protein
MLRSSVAAGLVVMCVTSGAFAFGSVNILGQQAEHERITRAALSVFHLGPETLDEIAGKRGTFGAVGAPDRPDRGLLSVNAAHCDSGDHLDTPGYPQSATDALGHLAACRAGIFAHLNAAVSAAGAIADVNGQIDSAAIPTHISCTYNGRPGRAKCNVLEQLGLAFHAAQDFYAHTNWVDMPADGPIGLTNPPGLGNSGPAPWINPHERIAPPAGLISGCFQGIPERLFCSGRVHHADLNKDTGPIDPSSGKAGTGTTKRGAVKGNFARAVAAAVADTRDKWTYFEARISETYGAVRGKAIICAIRNDDESACS